jgi:hypothetical protein
MGRKLMLAFEKKARELGCCKVSLNSRKQNTRRRLPFEQLARCAGRSTRGRGEEHSCHRGLLEWPAQLDRGFRVFLLRGRVQPGWICSRVCRQRASFC